jgi:hypothetical protein
VASKAAPAEDVALEALEAAGRAIADIARVQQALSQMRKGIKRTRKCPDCEEYVGTADGEHVLYMGFVIIGCKGTWVINPVSLEETNDGD